MHHNNYDYTKQIEAENEKLRAHVEEVETRNDALVEENATLTSRYDKGEVKLVSILLGNKKSGYLDIPLFAHPKQDECIKFIETHHDTYWVYPSVKKKLCEALEIKRLVVMYRIDFICGAKNKKKGDNNYYYGFSIFDSNKAAMYYDPRKKAFNVAFKPTRSL